MLYNVVLVSDTQQHESVIIVSIYLSSQGYGFSSGHVWM